MSTPPSETHNVPRRTNDHESGEYVTDPGRKGDVVIGDLHTGHTGPLNGVAWSFDGSLLATVGDDYTCVIWNPHTGDPVATLFGHTDASGLIRISHLDGTLERAFVSVRPRVPGVESYASWTSEDLDFLEGEAWRVLRLPNPDDGS